MVNLLHVFRRSTRAKHLQIIIFFLGAAAAVNFCSFFFLNHHTVVRKVSQGKYDGRTKKTHSEASLMNDITLVTHCSTSNLHSVLEQAIRWGGIVSAAVWVPFEKESLVFSSFVEENSSALEKVSFIEVRENDKIPTDYPANVARNAALDNAKTDFVLLLDADFITSRTLRRELFHLMNDQDAFSPSIRDLLLSKTMLVLPAFERLPMDAKESKNIMLAEKKEDILEHLKMSRLAPFHLKTFREGHGPTNFTAWINYQSSCRNTTEIPYYFVRYKIRYEPYVLAYKHGLPRYVDAFRGYHFNKYSWFMEAHYMGFKFAVLKEQFVIHMEHSFRYNLEKSIRKEYARNWTSFKAYLHETYGAPLEEMRDSIFCPEQDTGCYFSKSHWRRVQHS